MKIFCINLNSRKDRWSTCKKIFNQQKLSVERFSAIRNGEYPHYGVAVSHKKIIQIGKDKKFDMICVLEDDVELKKKFLKNLILAIDALPDDWHILYLGGLVCRNPKICKINYLVSKITHITCAYGMVYSNRFYDNFLSSIPDTPPKSKTDKHFNGFKTFDDWLALDYQEKYPCYVTNSFLVKPQKSYSDIEKKNRNVSRIYSLRFFLYRHGLGGLLNIIGDIGDKLGISQRALNNKNKI